MDANPEVAHKRFCERQGIDIKTDFNFDYNTADSYRDFCVGEKITIDTTDFTKVDYDEIDDLIINFIQKI
jgi:hypothetical protein